VLWPTSGNRSFTTLTMSVCVMGVFVYKSSEISPPERVRLTRDLRSCGTDDGIYPLATRMTSATTK